MASSATVKPPACCPRTTGLLRYANTLAELCSCNGGLARIWENRRAWIEGNTASKIWEHLRRDFPQTRMNDIWCMCDYGESRSISRSLDCGPIEDFLWHLLCGRIERL